MDKKKYGFYICIGCGIKHKALKISRCYRKKICPNCLNKIKEGIEISNLMDNIEIICGWTDIEELKKHYVVR